METRVSRCVACRQVLFLKAHQFALKPLRVGQLSLCNGEFERDIGLGDAGDDHVGRDHAAGRNHEFMHLPARIGDHIGDPAR